MNLHQWAARWNVSMPALHELREMFGEISTDPESAAQTPEGDVQNLIRLEASRKGLRLWRNNVGALPTVEGGFVRYGLANDSKAMNQKIKSSDLIGIRPVRIEPRHVGQIIGQFVAREVKRGGWQYSGTKREQAQLKYMELVTSLGGDAQFATNEGTL